MGKESAEEPISNVNSSHAEDTITELSYEDKLNYCNAIAKPMASKKLTKKIYKLLKKAMKHKKTHVRNGIKEVQKGIRKGEKGLIILAGDVMPIDMYSHVPALCEEKDYPYCYVPSRGDLGNAMGFYRSAILVLIREHPDYKELYDECYKEIKTLPICL